VEEVQDIGKPLRVEVKRRLRNLQIPEHPTAIFTSEYANALLLLKS
jgi:hypothetical protein